MFVVMPLLYLSIAGFGLEPGASAHIDDLSRYPIEQTLPKDLFDAHDAVWRLESGWVVADPSELPSSSILDGNPTNEH